VFPEQLTKNWLFRRKINHDYVCACQSAAPLRTVWARAFLFKSSFARPPAQSGALLSAKLGEPPGRKCSTCKMPTARFTMAYKQACSIVKGPILVRCAEGPSLQQKTQEGGVGLQAEPTAPSVKEGLLT